MASWGPVWSPRTGMSLQTAVAPGALPWGHSLVPGCQPGRPPGCGAGWGQGWAVHTDQLLLPPWLCREWLTSGQGGRFEWGQDGCPKIPPRTSPPLCTAGAAPPTL